MPSYDNKVLTGDQLVYYSGLVKTALAAKQDSLVFNTAYNASSNKVATMSDINGKQDALVFNTAYNASTNKVATMSDLDSCVGYSDLNAHNIATDFLDPATVEIDPDTGDESGTPLQLDDVLLNMQNDLGDKLVLEDLRIGNVIAFQEFDDQTGEVTNTVYLDDKLEGMLSDIQDKQDALEFNTAYNATTNKVATMSDITSALSGISSFSFEIVQSLPVSDISTSKIYLVAKQTSGTNQVYTEYAYVNNAWEIIGDTSMTIDTLSNSEVATIWATATATT